MVRRAGIAALLTGLALMISLVVQVVQGLRQASAGLWPGPQSRAAASAVSTPKG